jgi:hypothetical protein
MRMMEMTKRLETRPMDEPTDARSILAATDLLVFTLVVRAKNV